jgi:chorismate dehydratase
MTPRPFAAVPSAARVTRRLGCVSFLNSKPLIDGLEDGRDPVVKFDVPSRLLEDLETGAVDLALCPVIDYQRSAVPLEVVPVGGIACAGRTYTVRLFSQVPLVEIGEVYADTDSHTSVALARVLLAKRLGRRPRFIDYDAREQVAAGRPAPHPPTMLLIGDKVVTGAPPLEEYPHQLDLGEAWHDWTGLPFVFAVWMARAGADLGDLPAVLERTRLANAQRLDAIVDRYAAPLGWPRDLARQYLTHWLRYRIDGPALEAMQRFWQLAHELGAIERLRPLRVRENC